MTHHEIGGMQHDVEGRLCQEKSTHPATDEHRDHAQGKQGRRVDAQLRAIQATHPDQHNDRRGDGNNQRGEGECYGGNRIHAAHKHVMAVDHVAEHRQRAHGVNHDAVTQQRPAHIGNQNMGYDSHARYDCDVYLRMSKEPEQVLPQQSRAARMRLQLIVDH